MSECWTKSAEGNRAHFGLAVACAKRFQGRGVPMEELIGEAEAALLWAAVRFDEKRGVRFSTYAIPFALGALRELCRRNALMHIPREELRVLREAERRRERWQRENGREPTVEELAHGLGQPPEKLAAMLNARERMRSVTRDERLLAAAPDAGEAFESRVLWRDALRSLGRPYGQVLWMRFFGGLSQQEIAGRFGVSQAQVSRWEREGRRLLRESFGENADSLEKTRNS